MTREVSNFPGLRTNRLMAGQSLEVRYGKEIGVFVFQIIQWDLKWLIVK